MFFPRRQGSPSLASLLGCSGESGCTEAADLYQKRGEAGGKAQRKHRQKTCGVCSLLQSCFFFGFGGFFWSGHQQNAGILTGNNSFNEALKREKLELMTIYLYNLYHALISEAGEPGFLLYFFDQCNRVVPFWWVIVQKARGYFHSFLVKSVNTCNLLIVVWNIAVIGILANPSMLPPWE